MPCFVADNIHLNVLVNAAAQYDLHDAADPVGLGTMLAGVNRTAYVHRYSHCLTVADHEQLSEQYELERTEEDLHPYAVIKAAWWYQNQSRHHADWKDSAARLFINDLIAAVEGTLTEDELTTVNLGGQPLPYYRTTEEFTVAPGTFVVLAEAHEDPDWP